MIFRNKPKGEWDDQGDRDDQKQDDWRTEDEYSPPGSEASHSEGKVSRAERTDMSVVGLKFLNLLFPDNDWLHLSSHHDMYPFFQPIFKFPDGFGFLAPENPVQQVVIFLRVLEDLFRGTRNITFDFANDKEFNDGSDDFEKALDEWGVYQDILFGKHYAATLKDLVNRQTMEDNFIHTALGKRMFYNLMWQTKHYFLPNYTILAVGKSELRTDLQAPLLQGVIFTERLRDFGGPGRCGGQKQGSRHRGDQPLGALSL